MSSKSEQGGAPSQFPTDPWGDLVAAIVFLREEMFAHLKPHGNTKWKPLTLAVLGVLWSWGSTDQTLNSRFDEAVKLVQSWYPATYVFTTYNGLIAALATWNSQLIAIVGDALRQQIRTLVCWTDARRPMFGIDGTKVGVPWTDSTDRELGQQTLQGRQQENKSKQAKTAKPRSANSDAHQEVRPQLLLTVVWHMVSGLPWSWMSGPVSGSERDHARKLLDSLPPKSILVCDAGFTGYEFWSAILGARHDFVIRIGSNVKLLKNLGWKVRARQNIAWLWPDKQQRAGAAPIKVRLAKFRTKKTTVWLATSILKVKEMSDEELADTYRMRWGIEGWFRSLKQTFGRRTLRSRNAQHAVCELDWSIVGLGLIQLQGVKALEAAGQNPLRLSEAETIRVVRSKVMDIDFGLDQLPRLQQRLQGAVTDTYKRTRPKRGKHIHRKKKHKLPGEPRFREATPAQRRLARELRVISAQQLQPATEAA